jgi:hypothetical protein
VGHNGFRVSDRGVQLAGSSARPAADDSHFGFASRLGCSDRGRFGSSFKIASHSQPNGWLAVNSRFGFASHSQPNGWLAVNSRFGFASH